MKRNKKSSILTSIFIILFNLYSLLLVSLIGSNLSIQKNENMSKFLINEMERNSSLTSDLFVKYQVYSRFAWHREPFLPRTDIVYKFQKDFLKEELITINHFTANAHSKPFSLTQSRDDLSYSVVTLSDFDSMDIEVLAGKDNFTTSFSNHISISSRLADTLLSNPIYSSSTYSDLIGKTIGAYSEYKYSLYKNDYVISSVFLENKIYDKVKAHIGNDFIISTNTTAFPGDYSISFLINDLRVVTLQRLFGYIDHYLDIDKFYYDADGEIEYTIRAYLTTFNDNFEIENFNGLYNYYISNINIVFTAMFALLAVFFIWNLTILFNFEIQSKRHKKLLCLIFLSFMTTMLVISLLGFFTAGQLSINLTNYYSFVFIVALLSAEFAYIFIKVKKKRKDRRSVMCTYSKDTIPVIQQMPSFTQTSGLTTDYNNMIFSKTLSSIFDFETVSSKQGNAILNTLDYVKQLGECNGEIIIIRGAGIDSLWPSIAAKIKKKKIILAIHGMWSDLVYLNKVKKWISLRLVENILLTLCDGFYTVYAGAINKPLLSNYRDKYLGTIYNPIVSEDSLPNDDKIDLSDFFISEQDVVGLYTGRITDEKGLMYLIRAFEKFILEKGKTNVKLLFLGSGPHITKYKEYILDKKLDKNIYFLGEKSNVIPYIKLSNFFVFPSLHENMPFSIIEAMKNNKHIIASSVGGIPELLANYNSKTLIEPGDSNELLKALSAVINEKRYLIKGNFNEFSESFSEFSITKFEDNMVRIINETLID